jgi:transposase InsO family protein
MKKTEITHTVLQLVSQIRVDHPTMNCRSMYYKLRPEGIGRDAFELICSENGYRVGNQCFRPRTTDSTGVIRFPNILSEVELTAPHQAWSSDITYYELNERYYYITFIIDCFTRVIVGHKLSEGMRTVQTTVPAIEQAVSATGKRIKPGLVFHSDGGGQYYAKEFIACTSKHKMINSMCRYAYENGKAERLNGVIKNNYLRHDSIKSYRELQQKVDRAVKLYNHQKPHKSLGYQTPKTFEEKHLSLQEQTKPTMTESLDANTNYNRASSPVIIKQTKPLTPDVLSANTELQSVQKRSTKFRH